MNIKSEIMQITRTDFFKIISTSIVTALLTLVSSYYLMFSQLKEEQNYWITRTHVERVQELLDRRIKLFEELNSKILLNEVLSKDFKVFSAVYMANLELKMNYGGKLDNNMSTKFDVKALELHKGINELGAKIQMCELYFGAEVDSLLNPLSKAIGENYSRNLVLGDSIKLSDKTSVASYFDKDFETIKELTENRLSILKAMRAEIDTVNKTLFFDILVLEK
jgi:hypothetical protein